MIQRKVHRYGWVKDKLDHRDAIKATYTRVLDLPEFASCYDLLLSPYDQEQEGSCISNATGQGVAAAYDHAGFGGVFPNDDPPSRHFIYYGIRQIENTGDEDCGGQVRDGIKAVAKWGVCGEKLWSYDQANFAPKPSEAAYAEALNHKAIKYERVSQDINSLKAVIANEGLPIIFGMEVFDYFESEEMSQNGLMHMPGFLQSAIGGHCIIACEFDDNKRFDDVRCGVGGFRVMNSWGGQWGCKDKPGTFWMPFKFITNHGLCSDFWTVQKETPVLKLAA